MLKSYFFYYKFFFQIALSLSALMFTCHMVKREHFVLRLLLVGSTMMVLTYFYPSEHLNALTSSLMFTLFFILLVPAICFCFETTALSSLFCASAAYSVQHIASIANNQVAMLAGISTATQFYSDSSADFSLFSAIIMLEVYLLVYFLSYHLFVKRLHRGESPVIARPVMLYLVALVILVEIVLNAFVIYMPDEDFSTTYFLCSSLTNMLCSIAVLVIMFGQLLSKKLESELLIVKQLREQERRQYDISRETIDMINIKCHDMRHQIHAIRHHANIDPQALKDLEQSIDIYDSIVKTGNEALDVIMAEKSLFCQKHGITINCIIDGEKLSFMSTTDIYSLFGNMLENAIHSALRLEQEKRIISVIVKSRGELLSISCRNYFSGEIVLQQGMPVTQEGDKTIHGFGTKSMKMIVDKYGGTITFEADSEVFSVSILLPLPDEGGVCA